eukprot:COSAG01_NODE_2105_length_8423_cov_6.483409_4_plen_84_part_00
MYGNLSQRHGSDHEVSSSAQEPTASAVVEGGGVGVLEQLLYAGGNSDTLVEGALHCMRNLARSSAAAARALVAAHGGEGTRSA